jgi:hypothetical protein
MLRQLFEVRPGISSQTTSVFEEIGVQDMMNLSFFNINAPVIEAYDHNKWNEIASQLLQEYTQLWERLAVL